jgi:hypothetical protein
MTSITALLDLGDRMPWPRNVKHLALVGHPKAGKSAVAQFLEDEFGGVIIDDGLPLRRALPILTGIPEELCFTQEGKASTVRVGDRDEVVRQGLGELGNWLEARYGEEILAILAMKHALETYPHAPFYIYPSVRKTQPRAYRRMGGVVIQIDNPTVGPSGNAFDVWEASQVDIHIENDPSAMNLEELREYITRIPDLIEALSA